MGEILVGLNLLHSFWVPRVLCIDNDPMQSKAYNYNVHFGTPLDGKALLKDYSTNVTTVLLI
jgi:hypothetical protein